MRWFPSPVDVFGSPKNALGEKLDPQDTWLEWVLMPRHQPIFAHFVDNVRAGITVALVSVPLSIALAIASGASPAQGIVSSVWAGLVASLVGSSHFNVIGPTGALSGLLAAMAGTYGSGVLAPLALQSGLWILLFFFLRANRFMIYVSSGVAHGFGIGVAIVIAVSQIPAAFGLRGVQPRETLMEKLDECFAHIGTISIPDTLLFLVSIVPLVVPVKRLSKFPLQIVVAAFGVLVARLVPRGNLVLLSTKYPELELHFFTAVPLQQLASPQWFSLGIIPYSFGCALVSLMETLISSMIANNHVVDKSFLNYSSSRDTFGLAVSNIVVAFLGGIPSTAALARTALMVNAGAFNRVAGIFSAAVTALLCSLLLPLFVDLPMATVAAILMVVAYKLVDFHIINVLRVVDTANLYSLLVTAAACALTDTFIGLMIGIVISVLLNYSGDAEVLVVFEEEDETFDSPSTPDPVVFRVLVVQPHISLLFFNAEVLKTIILRRSREFAMTTPSRMRKRLIIDLTMCSRIDFDGTQKLGEIISAHRERHWRVDVANARHLRNNLALCTPYLELQRLQYDDLF